MPEINIEDLSPKRKPIPEWLAKDSLTMAEHLLGMGNAEEAEKCYIAAGMDSKQVKEMIRDWRDKHKETIH